MASTVCTKLDVDSNSIKLTWEISNFSLNGKNMGECLVSPDFKLGSKNSEWFLGLFPKGFGEENSSYVSLYIFRYEKNPKIEIEFSFAILDSKGQEANNCQRAVRIDNNLANGFGKFISISDLKKYLINDKLTIVSKIRAGANIIQIPIEPSAELSQDFQILFENQKFTDVTLNVKEKTFRAHKVILSARSRVFSALFQHDMQENINSRVDIEDAEPNVVEEMLRFIYTGKVKDLNLIAYELFKISDQYLLDGLKLICEDTLCKSLSVENVLEMISLADLYNAKTLKTKAEEFRVTHAKEIVQTAAFKSAENLNIQIVLER